MKLVIFDMDGTLIDSQAFIVDNIRSCFVEMGLEAPEHDRCRRIIGLSLEVALAELSGLDEAGVTELTRLYRQTFLQRAVGNHETQEALYPGARDAVAHLSGLQDHLLGIATGKSLRGVERVMGAHDLLQHFVTRQTPDTNPSKPHPGMVLEAMKETGAMPVETVMIGDTSFDMEMARKAGVRAIGVNWGYHTPHDLFAAGAHAVVDSFPALLTELSQDWKASSYA